MRETGVVLSHPISHSPCRRFRLSSRLVNHMLMMPMRMQCLRHIEILKSISARTTKRLKKQLKKEKSRRVCAVVVGYMVSSLSLIIN